MSHPKWHIPRRTVLKGLGTMIALPMLEAMVPSIALAAGSAPKRLGLLAIPNGINLATFVPSDSLSNLGKSVPLSAGISTDLMLLTSGNFASANLRNDLTLITGLDNVPGQRRTDNGSTSGDGHNGGGCILNCSPVHAGELNHTGNQSMDQVIADAIGGGRLKKYVNFGRPKMTQDKGWGWSSAYYSDVSWRADQQAADKYETPHAAFQDLFKGLNPVENNQRVDLQSKYKMGILHFVNSEIKALRSRLGKNDQSTLDQFLTSVEEKERDLASTSTPAALTCDPNSFQYLGTTVNFDSYDKWFKNIVDVMYLAFRCDLTPVSVFQVDYCGGFGIATGSFAGAKYSPHAASHYKETAGDEGKDPAMVREQYRLITMYYIQRYGDLIAKMKATPELKATGEMGNMLDNSIIGFVPRSGDADAHSKWNIPILLAGTGGGAIVPGRHHNFSKFWKPDFPSTSATADERGHTGRPLADLWLTLIQAMGVDRTSFANSTGTLNLRG